MLIGHEYRLAAPADRGPDPAGEPDGHAGVGGAAFSGVRNFFLPTTFALSLT